MACESCLILWSNEAAHAKSAVFDAIDCIVGERPDLAPKYTDTGEFSLSEESVDAIVRDSRDAQYPQNGSRAVLFTRKRAKYSHPLYMFSVGVEAEVGGRRMPNSFELRLHADTFPVATLEKTFLKLVDLFRPYWGAVRDVAQFNAAPIGVVDQTKVPQAIHWLNYFGAQFVERVGADKLERAAFHQCQRVSNGGLFCMLQSEPLEFGNPEHVQHQSEVENSLGLPQLHAAYPDSR